MKNKTIKEHLEKWLKTEEDKKEKGINILCKKYLTFKLKKRNIKSKSSRFKRNTKVLVFLFKDCIPTSVSFSNLENCNPRENGYKYTVGITYSLDGDFGPKRDAAYSTINFTGK